jgi:acyl-CoA oxidase
MKAVATWHATAAIQAAREACGGSGYLSENRLVQLKADTDVFTTFEGDNTVLLQLVAKGLLSGYRDTFAGLDRRGRARAITAAVLDTLAVRTEARAVAQRIGDALPRGRDAGGDADASELLDRPWQLRTLAWREKRVLDGLVARMRALAKASVDRAELTNEVQDHMVLAARVHVERVVAESAASAVDSLPHGPTRELLSRVLDLHVLAELERDRAWFLERGWISPRRSKALTAAVNDLCAELRPHASTLVAGFGIPREWWGAAITAPAAG